MILEFCLFVCLCGPQKLQIDFVTPSDGLSLFRDSTSSPRTILLNFFTTLMLVGRGMEEGKGWYLESIIISAGYSCNVRKGTALD